MTAPASVVSARTFMLGLPQPGDDLVIACMACWPLSDGHLVFGPTWPADRRDEAEAECARHNAARHPQATEAAA
ncbi:hypothetical protein [Tsukamurella sp. NPDC003166]|uniref:hypothetical protein n=1 Tax=Tsukamurella sp. NPDC003166 TaxID=3154444 RepID=UPI0033B50B7E